MKPSKSIWLIDDDHIFRLILERVIRKNAYFDHIDSFDDGDKAYQALLNKIENGEGFPDVIFLDINMPGWDGWKFLSALSDLGPDIQNESRIYLTTSSIYDEDLEKSKLFSILSGYLVKPIRKEDLAAISEKIVQL